MITQIEVCRLLWFQQPFRIKPPSDIYSVTLFDGAVLWRKTAILLTAIPAAQITGNPYAVIFVEGKAMNLTTFLTASSGCYDNSETESHLQCYIK